MFYLFKVGHSRPSHRLPRDNQRDREQQTLLKSISTHRELIPVWEQLATDQFDPWQVFPRQVFIPYSRLLISAVFVVVNRVGCLGVTGEAISGYETIVRSLERYFTIKYFILTGQ